MRNSTADVRRSRDVANTGTPAVCIESTGIDISGGVFLPFRIVSGIAEQLLDMVIPERNYEIEDERWFSTPERQRGEAEADHDIAEGRLARFSNVEDLIKDLRS